MSDHDTTNLDELEDDSSGGGFHDDDIDGDFDDGDFDDGGPVMPRKPMKDSADMDITPMIDIVFLLLIFFLVSSTPDKNTAVELPPARYGVGVSEKNSVVITIDQPQGSGKVQVFVADGRKGKPLSEDPTEKTASIVAAVEDGFFHQSKSQVLIKAGRKVKRKEVYAVEIAVSRADVKVLTIYHGVYEKN